MLTAPADHRGQLSTTVYINHLAKSFEFKNEDLRAVELCTESLVQFAEQRQVNFRAINKIFSTLVLALAFTDERRLRLAPILAGLCILKVMYPDLYRKAKEGRLSYTEAKSALGLDATKLGEERRNEWTVKWWRYCTDPQAEKDLVQHFDRDMARYNYLSRFAIVPYTANDVIDRLVAVSERT